MKIRFNKKYNTISFYTVVTFAVCLLMVVVVMQFPVISGFLKTLGKVLSPFVWGIVIAYLANPILVGCEKAFGKLFEKKKPHPKLKKVTTVALTMLAVIAIIAALIGIILPQIVDSIISIFNNAKSYIDTVQNWLNGIVEKYPEASDYVMGQFNNFEDKLMTLLNDLQPKLVEMAGSLTQGVWKFAMGIKDFLLGLMVALYLLAGKHTFIAQLRRLTVAVLPKRSAASFIKLCGTINNTLSGFISGKILDSFIIGIICFIGMTFMDMPFVTLISVIIGATNVIPFFGPFIGAIPTGLVILLADPKQFIPFIIFILALQQFDGNVLGPKILGDSTGLPAFWVMFSIIVGGGLFGFAGMLLGVPVFAVIYTLCGDAIRALLTKKSLPENTEDYSEPCEFSENGELIHANVKSEPEECKNSENQDG